MDRRGAWFRPHSGADPQAANAQTRGACPAHARATSRPAAQRRSAVRPWQADDSGRHRLADRDAGGQPVAVRFDAPASARPAQEVDLVLHMSDPAGHPLAGEATVWMVDQAVLSLAKEQPLDPLPAFIVAAPQPHGGARHAQPGVRHHSAERGAGRWRRRRPGCGKHIRAQELHARAAVSAACSMSGADGIARIHVKLPDTLTVYHAAGKGDQRAGPVRLRRPAP